ncbi:glutathione S-transferase family protein [Roseomonas haemaphysalidis]|uniref:Glutathione S-transferase family protein n=1 Tax=Roseomonas haemaphysalidis TaxID=2768162 RepID=A0ABS3KTD8_9PROT|nr:glutathione S-transferase family protein [Roseomonas haemaphysalidis]MBO1080689.1 glutathione S-transferase family protein [Roseomonas haemaphysalidis]
MSLTIYGVLRSRASRPVWLAKELGLDYRHVPVIQGYRLPDPGAPDAPLNTTSTAFRAINPNGLVPSVDDDGLILHESMAITLHLARKHGGPLAPRDGSEDALATMWSFWAVTTVETPALSTRGGADAIAQAMPVLDRAFAVLADALQAGGGWLVGGRFTVADLNVAEVVRYAAGVPTLFETHRAVRDWLAVCHARPAFQAMWAERDAEPA